jgi:hypothetical protein
MMQMNAMRPPIAGGRISENSLKMSEIGKMERQETRGQSMERKSELKSAGIKN